VAEPAYGWRGEALVKQVAGQGPSVAALFWAMFGELQFTPKDRSIGVREFKAQTADELTIFTVPFTAGVLLYRVDEGERVIEFVDVAWNL
jgi:hypothetical protein